MEIRPGIHRLGAGMVNSYILEETGELTIVDAAMAGFWSDLPAELAAMGRSLDDVRALVLTHGHSDHIGFAERFRRERHITPKVHELDAALARGEVPSPASGIGKVKFGPFVRFILLGLRKGGLRTTPLAEVATFGDGATLDVPGAPRVILVPGHTPGSAVLHVPSLGAAFIGDAMATYSVAGGMRGPQIAPFTADRQQALASLSRLDDLEAKLLLPGHGDPWTDGAHSAVAAVRASEAPPS